MNIDTSQLRKFCDNLIKIKVYTFPQIINNLLSTTVYEISNKLKKEVIPNKFKKRNNFSIMSIRYDKANGYDLSNMYSMVGQLQNAGSISTKTLLEENELGTSITSKTKHTVLGLKNIRTNKSFNKTITKQNRLTTLEPKSAQNILSNYRNTDNNTNTELSRIMGLIASNRIHNNIIVAHTKKNTLGVFKIEKSGDDGSSNNSGDNNGIGNNHSNHNSNNGNTTPRLYVTKLYSLEDKQNKIKRTTWLKDTYQDQLKDSNLQPIYTKIAQKILDKNANAFHMKIRN